MEKTINRIDAYIQKDTDDYCIYFNYNGIDYTSIYKDTDTKKFAFNFNKRYLKTTAKFTNHNFVDDHGKTITSIKEESTILASIIGIKSIDNAIIRLIAAGVHPEVNSDITIYLQGKKYDLVKDADKLEYFSPDIIKSKEKGLSIDGLNELSTDLNNLKNTSIQYQKKANIG